MLLTHPGVQFFQVWQWGSRAAWRAWPWTPSWAGGTSAPSWPWPAARWAAGRATWPTCAEDQPPPLHSLTVTVSLLSLCRKTNKQTNWNIDVWRKKNQTIHWCFTYFLCFGMAFDNLETLCGRQYEPPGRFCFFKQVYKLHEKSIITIRSARADVFRSAVFPHYVLPVGK